jgi:uncharacterized membrane protein (GlpM family)
MKKQIILLLAWFIKLWTNTKLIALIVAGFFKNCYGWVRSLLILSFKSIARPYHSYGYSHWYFAKRYSLKRTLKTKHKRKGDVVQSILPYGETSLLVCSQREIKRWQNKGYVNASVGYSKLFKGGYFKTKQP